MAHRQPGLSGQIQRIMLEHDAARAEHFLLPGQAHVQVRPPSVVEMPKSNHALSANTSSNRCRTTRSSTPRADDQQLFGHGQIFPRLPATRHPRRHRFEMLIPMPNHRRVVGPVPLKDCRIIELPKMTDPRET